MYEWLAEKAKLIRWKQFFSFQRDASGATLVDAKRRFGTLPRDYTQFLQQFGEARLFRHLQRGSYNLAVFSRPRIHQGKGGELLLEIAFFINGGYAHLRKRNPTAKVEPGVFEGVGPQVHKAADSFEEWLKRRYKSAQRLYKQSDWRRILEGATPFTDDELKLVEAIGLFSFQRVGTASNGNMQIRVFNRSRVRLRYLTIGARALGRLDGTLYLDVSGIGPGEMKVIEHDCYKSIVTPDKIELFPKPRPEPEERGMYYEFGAPEWISRIPRDYGRRC